MNERDALAVRQSAEFEAADDRTNVSTDAGGDDPAACVRRSTFVMRETKCNLKVNWNRRGL